MSKPKPDEKSLIETVLMLAESEIDTRRACGGEGVEEADGLEKEIKRARPLIEAAPDLLEAVESLLEIARNPELFTGKNIRRSGVFSCNVKIAQAQTTIWKAKGKHHEA